MSDGRFGDYRIAADMEAVIRQIAASEVNKMRPKGRMAQVVSIDTEARTLVVTFVGEIVNVTVPYVSTIPANVGQYVRIGGTTHDRYVEDVIGTTDTQARLAVQETMSSARVEAFGTYGLSLNGTCPQNTLGDIAFNTPLFDQVGTAFTVSALGLITFNEAGHYRVTAQVGLGTLATNNNIRASIWYRHNVAMTGATLDFMRASSGSGVENQVIGDVIREFGVNDTLKVITQSFGAPRPIPMEETYLTIQLVRRTPPSA